MQSCASVDAFVSHHREISDFFNSLLEAYDAILFMLICLLPPRGGLIDFVESASRKFTIARISISPIVPRVNLLMNWSMLCRYIETA